MGDATSATGSRVVLIPPSLAGMRLDQALAACDHTLSRSVIQRLIRQGAICRDEGIPGADALRMAALDPADRVRGGERFCIEPPPPEPMTATPEAIPLVIRYEDDHLLVVDKAAGLVVHPGAGNARGTLVNALLHHCGVQVVEGGRTSEGGEPGLSGVGGPFRPGIVHRLDKDTSGLLVVAKNDAVHAALAEQFAAHSVTRRYLALIRGLPRPHQGTIDAPIGRHPTRRTRMAVTSRHGRRAVTHFTILERFAGLTLIACRLETGRTHQIRVHLAHIGHPVLGDPVYSRPFQPPGPWPEAVRMCVTAFRRQALHAAALGFTHPVTGQRLEYDAPLPTDFAELLAALRSLSQGFAV
ncbi:MAG: RluA family pseudouridine synthase [Magnetococcales bacterium]|nr:RluA family pseudouridine synthase [Magnetococcales bacterium]